MKRLAASKQKTAKKQNENMKNDQKDKEPR